MEEYEFLLEDRLTKIRAVIEKYGQDNFIIAFSGGKDSTVLSWLVDRAIPSNSIPRMYVDTGIDLNAIRDFVYELQKDDPRFIIVKPTKNIKQILDENGYPFKSKKHSCMVERYNRIGLSRGVSVYSRQAEDGKEWNSENSCPKILQYQFMKQNACGFPISDKCCALLKEKPFSEMQKKLCKPWAITGIMRDEGGRRTSAVCINMSTKNFNPLSPITKEIEEKWINKYNIKLCKLYYPPYNFNRTGCKGCPFSRNLQHELDVLKEYFPNEYKQCEYIWQPVYDEYRRLNYRLKKENKQ